MIALFNPIFLSIFLVLISSVPGQAVGGPDDSPKIFYAFQVEDHDTELVGELIPGGPIKDGDYRLMAKIKPNLSPTIHPLREALQ